MTNNYRLRVRKGEIEVEVESTDQSYVDSKIDQYLARLGNPVQQIEEDKTAATLVQNQGARPMSIGEFSRLISPQKKNEVAATVAYFLEYHGGMEEWKPDDVAEKFTEIRRPKPANTSDLLNKSNYFMRGRESGFYRLSETGVRWVEERLNNAKQN